MSLNDGFSETYIFHVKKDIFKVVINFTKGMCTVYAPSGRILMRKEKLSQKEAKKIKKKIVTYLDDKKQISINFSKGGVIL